MSFRINSYLKRWAVALPGRKVHNINCCPGGTSLRSGIQTICLRFENIKSSLACFVGMATASKGVEPSFHIGKLSRTDAQ